jgi:hypothetical protein
LKVAAFNSTVQLDLRHECVAQKHCPAIGASVAWLLFAFAHRF